MLPSTSGSEQQTRYIALSTKASSGDNNFALFSGRRSPPFQKRGKCSGFVETGRNLTCKRFFWTPSGTLPSASEYIFLSRRRINALARSKAALLLSSFKMPTLCALSSNIPQGGSSATIPSCSSLVSLIQSKNVSSVPKGNLSSSI